jgi:biopolymer transport protein ExbD
MGLKKRSKVSAEFSMSSLTDIIFLLLIFFMLTSTLVKIQPFDLPESDSKTVAPTSAVVTIDKSGKYTVNNTETSKGAIERALRAAMRKQDKNPNATITIVAEKGVPFENVRDMMEIAARLRVNAIIATQPRPKEG